ncbi:MAG: hypothetical protein L6306_14895 [Planctomycetales bacterium]|nr:hypothetical protein [Planctomycetales bacterium]
MLGPTIPHYSMVGDSLFGVGSPGMTVFDWTGRVANGSGINLDAGHTYDWTAVYTNLGTGYIDSSANVYTGGSFIMLNGYLWGYGSNSSTLSVADIGSWTYVETWTDRAGGEGSFISSTTNFSIVPEPASVLVWCLLGAGSWLGMRVWRRRRVPVGRQSWSPENRQAIHDIITR